MIRRARLRNRRIITKSPAALVLGGFLLGVVAGCRGPGGAPERQGAAPERKGPRPSAEWVQVLAPGMTTDEISAAIGVRGRWMSEAKEGFEWTTREAEVMVVLEGDRATMVIIKFGTPDRPPVQASALAAVVEGMSPVEVEEACGGPGLIRHRNSSLNTEGAITVSETREWEIFDGDQATGRTFTVGFVDDQVFQAR